jgi:hypothetical protein
MSELRTDTITASDGTSPVTLTKQSAAKLWCHLDLNTENTIDGSLNVSSISDISTGKFSATTINAMSDINYTSAGNAWNGTSGNNGRTITPYEARTTTTIYNSVLQTATYALEDCQDVDMVNHGDLA